MIVDFHVHTAASPDGELTVGRLIDAVRRRGLDAVAVCDHGSLAGSLAVAAEAPFLVIPSSEIMTSEGEVIGWFLREDIQAGLPAEETVDRIRAQGALVCVPHPFDRFRRSALAPEALERVADRVDAVEGLNGRNLLAADDMAAVAWAEERGIAIVAGSDAHTYHEVGCVQTTLPRFSDAASLREALYEAERGGRRSSPLVHLRTVVRKRLK